MLYQISSFVFDVAFGLLAGACLLRAYMPIARVPFQNPIGQFVMALTNWLVIPLRRVLPPLGAIDSASIVAALLLQVVHYALLWLMIGMFGWGAGGNVISIAWLAIFAVFKLALTGMIGLLIVYAVISWVRVDTPIGDVIERLCALPLAPIRKLLPLVGGFDLSPLALIVALQILLMVLQRTLTAVLVG
jgi:YggT family protein